MAMIKCTDEQAYLIELCLETMCRASLGQLMPFVESIEKIRGKSFKVKCPDGEVRSFYSLKKYIEEMIKPILFPELAPNESYGVGHKAIGKGQVLYEMVKVLENYRAEKNNHPEHSVTWHKPLHYSKEPLIEVMSLQNEPKQAKCRTIVKGKNRKDNNGKGKKRNRHKDLAGRR